ncbi:MPPV-294 CC chemokine-like protein [Magpiepox virus 2]|nr:MPPV-294 CC chemokine-like protein [Magpiepox virus 2]
MHNNTITRLLFVYILLYHNILNGEAICCNQYSRNKISKDDIAIIRYSSCTCKSGPAVIFRMVNGKEICILEDATWLQSILDYMNARWLSCENEGVVISNFLLEEQIIPYSSH